MRQRGRARLQSIGPWDKRDASRAVLLLLSVMSVLNLVNVLAFDTPSRAARIISFAQPALWAVLLPQFLKHGHRRPAPLYSVFGVLSGVLITVISTVYAAADASLYRAKRQGRNQVGTPA